MWTLNVSLVTFSGGSSTSISIFRKSFISRASLIPGLRCTGLVTDLREVTLAGDLGGVTIAGDLRGVTLPGDLRGVT